MQTIRYGLVGTGMMGVEHLHNLAITPGAVVTAIADPVPESIAWARGALGDRAHDVAAFDTASADDRAIDLASDKRADGTAQRAAEHGADCGQEQGSHARSVPEQG